ncbi:MAG: L,D-transpeptidase family protein [Bacteroidia bacterium]|nr:L,D-transpeptidase family protein [Bacteroidia bacterium]
MKPYIYSILLALTCFWACKQPNQETLNELVDEGVFEKSELVEVLQTLVEDTNVMKKYRFGDTLAYFYTDNKFDPIWALYMVNDSMAEPVLNTLYKSREDGLKPDYYQLDSIRNVLNRLKKGKKDELYRELADLELLISDNVLSYHHDRVMGRTDPRVVFEGVYQLPKRNYENFELLKVLDYDDYSNVLGENTIADTGYVYLKDLLKTYLDRVDKGEQWFNIDTTGVRKLEPGDTTELLPQIARKLAQIQVITEKEMLEADSHTYNKSFAKYVRRFQQRFGLFDDAVFGRKTFGLLNASLDDRINEIAANLERIRWFKGPEEGIYVLVNLPAYELNLHYEDSVKTMAVCIGKARPHDYDEKVKKAKETGKWWIKPADHQTPQIYSKIAYMVVNPTWNVPRSIISREMWYRMKRDSMYLANAGYGVFYKKKEIRSDTIDWSQFKPSRLPFEIIQKSGEDNALGKVKFIFPNKFSIYLHDTPQKSKFKWHERSVSHGCVRIQDPLLMGEFLTQAIDTMDSDDFRIHMGYEPLDEERLEEYDAEDTTARIQPLEDTHLIRLNEQVPVFFVYRTMWYDQEWKLQYRNDVYRKNKHIIDAMNF